VESVRVLRSVKFLDEAAVEAVKQWRYQPLVLNGVATPSAVGDLELQREELGEVRIENPN
jgi:TonB family protein